MASPSQASTRLGRCDKVVTGDPDVAREVYRLRPHGTDVVGVKTARCISEFAGNITGLSVVTGQDVGITFPPRVEGAEDQRLQWDLARRLRSSKMST